MCEALHQLADIHYGKSPAEVLDDEGEIPLFGTGGCFGRVSRPLFSGPAVIVARKGSLGTPHYSAAPFWASDTTFAVVPKPGVDARWLYHALSLFDLTRLNEATGVPSISRDWLRRIELKSELPEQRRHVAEILGTVDEVIKQTEALIAKQQQVKEGLMHDLFTRGLTPDGQLRPARAEAPDLYHETSLGWLPKEWESTTVGECLLGIDAGKSPECPDTPAVGEQWGVLKVGAVHPDGLREHENKVVVGEALRVASYLVAKGDLLFSRANTSELVGLSCHVTSQPRNLMISDKTLRLRVHSSCMTVRFFFWVLQTPTSRRQIENSATGTSGSMKNISQGGVRGIACARPDLDEQQRITQRLDAATDTLAAEMANLAKLRQLKQGLMQALLTPPV
jgi:type I restriction enzyme S subunit